MIIRNSSEKPVHWGKFVGRKVFIPICFCILSFGEKSIFAIFEEVFIFINLYKDPKIPSVSGTSNGYQIVAHFILKPFNLRSSINNPMALTSYQIKLVSTSVDTGAVWATNGTTKEKENNDELKFMPDSFNFVYLESLNQFLVISMAFVVWRSNNKTVDFGRYGHRITVHGWLKFDFRN